MKNLSKRCKEACAIMSIFLVFFSIEGFGQSIQIISDSVKLKTFVPYSQKIINSLPPIIISNTEKIEARLEKGAYIFGKVLPTHFTPKDFKLIAKKADFSTWALKIEVENATNTDARIQDFILTDSSYIFVSNELGNEAFGPITKSNAPVNNKLYSTTLKGNKLIIYLVEKNKTDNPSSQFTISGVTLGVASPNSNPMARVASSGPNAVCRFPEIEGISNSVVYYTLEGKDGNRFSCTGTLVNNERTDRTPYMLTARHCITDTNFDVDLSSTEKNYTQSITGIVGRRMSSCYGGFVDQIGNAITGATFKSAWFYTDFALVEFNSNNLPLNPNINYSAWTRDDLSGNGTMVAHPNSEPQKYSLGSKDFSGDPWKYQINWVVGDGAEGSSGGALYNDNKYIVGVNSYGLFGYNRFGTFSGSWESGAIDERRLKPYLSPNQNLQSMNFLIPTAMEVSNRAVLCYGSTTTISMPNLYPSETVNWNVGPAGSNLTILSYTNNSVTVTPSSPTASGLGIVTATIGGRQKIQYLTVGVPEKATTRILNYTTSTLTDLKDNQSINFCTDQDNYLEVQNINYGEGNDIVTGAEWTFPGTWNPTIAYGGINGEAVGVNTSFYGGTFSVKLSNACGWQQSPTYVGANMIYCNGYYAYSVYPNPAKDELTVEFENTKEQKKIPESFELFEESTFGKSSALRSFYLTNEKIADIKQNKKITFDVRDLPRGRYILQVKTENSTEKKVNGLHIILEK